MSESESYLLGTNFAQNVKQSSNTVNNAKTRHPDRQLLMLFHMVYIVVTLDAIQGLEGQNVFLTKSTAMILKMHEIQNIWRIFFLNCSSLHFIIDISLEKNPNNVRSSTIVVSG